MKTIIYKLSLIFLSASFLTSCQTFQAADSRESSAEKENTEKKGSAVATAINEFQQQARELPAISNQEMLDSLLPGVQLDMPANMAIDRTQLAEEKFDVSVKNIDARSFLLGLVNSTPYNMVVNPDVATKISLQLKNVTVSEVLSAVERIYPLMVEKQGSVYFVSSAESMTTIYPVDYINLIRSGKSRTNVAGQTVVSGQSGASNQSGGTAQNSGGQSNNSSGQSSVNQLNSTEINTESKLDFWVELQQSLSLIIKDEEKANVVVSPQAGVVIVKALPRTQKLIAEYLGITQESLNRHVILEAKIIEVTLKDGFQSGIDWKKIYTVNGGDSLTIGQQGQSLLTDQSDTPLNGILSMLYQSNSFVGAIDLLKTQGDVQVLSSPRISTINNQKAVIKVGSDEFFVTDVSTTTVTGTSTATTPDVTLTPFFSGISLDVTPQINQNGDIILHVHPVISEVSDQQKTFTLGQDQFSLPLALTNVRESDSIIRTQNRQVVVIGGLMQNRVSSSESSTPLLGDIPFVGNLFKQKRDSIVKSELVILLKANIVDSQSSQTDLDNIKNRFNQY